MYGLVIAFKDYKIKDGFGGGTWVGMEVFKKVFSHRQFKEALRNTLLLNVLDLVVSFPMPIILALLLNEIRCKWFKKVSQTVLYLPHFLSWIIIGALAYQLFSQANGVVNTMLENLGIGSVNFLQDDQDVYKRQIGTSMLQMPNIIRKPVIWLPAIVTSAILGPISTCILQMTSNATGSGMGTCGLVGQIMTYQTMVGAGTAPAVVLAEILIMQFLAPAALALAISEGMRRAGLIKDGDMKLDI